MLVTWMSNVLDDLAGFYVTLSLAEQDDVAQTVARINAELSLDPDIHGESREANSRIWFYRRLAVRYVVHRKSGKVVAYNVRLLRGQHR